ncbi:MULTISPECIES: hypothetical protein [Streptomyces]|uniref:Uncharacterized protein n=2 Tax=Streptomyces TaxID=1883 RepID=A0ABV9J1U7_9ACTN
MKRQIALSLGAAALLIAATASPASAGTAHNSGSGTIWTGSDGTVLCYTSIENRDYDNHHSDVKGRFESHVGFGCQGWLERKSDEYNWTRVSNNYFISDGQHASTAWHWNGGSAQSRVCIVLTANGEKVCSTGL